VGNIRSICPGRHLSDNSLYAVVASVLAVFDIKPPLDADGKPAQLSTDVTSGLISYVILLRSFRIQAGSEMMLDTLYHSIVLSRPEARLSRVSFMIVYKWIDPRVFDLFCLGYSSIIGPLKAFSQAHDCFCCNDIPNFGQGGRFSVML